MLVELEGEGGNVKSGVQYLKDQGVTVEEAIKDIELNDTICTSCGVCTAVCLTGALTVSPPEYKLTLDKDRCILCGSCVEACPFRLIKVKF